MAIQRNLKRKEHIRRISMSGNYFYPGETLR